MYYNDYDDFYDEPSEFEQQVDEFKNSLLKVVKQEYIEEMEKLKKENEELQEIKKNFEKIKSDYKEKERELKLNESTIERRMRNARLSELMKDKEIIMYQASWKYMRVTKCNKCDDYRKVHFKSPSGKDATEECECAKRYTTYYPNEYIAYEIKLNSNKTISVWYKLENYDKDEYFEKDSKFAECVYDENMKYEDVNAYRTFFKSKEDCQKYCDWLNRNNPLNLEIIK